MSSWLHNSVDKVIVELNGQPKMHIFDDCRWYGSGSGELTIKQSNWPVFPFKFMAYLHVTLLRLSVRSTPIATKALIDRFVFNMFHSQVSSPLE